MRFDVKRIILIAALVSLALLALGQQRVPEEPDKWEYCRVEYGVVWQLYLPAADIEWVRGDRTGQALSERFGLLRAETERKLGSNLAQLYNVSDEEKDWINILGLHGGWDLAIIDRDVGADKVTYYFKRPH